MDFGKLPPEINSARLYSGPGASSMLAAATAWDKLAAELYDAATNYHAAISPLADGRQGAAATEISRTAASYVGWLKSTAAAAEHTATQARAAADAYESAFAATVPPQLVIANRASRMSLAAKNFLGQATPAIAAAEADYERMWVQAAAAMYAYADDSAAASIMRPFSSPTVEGPAPSEASADQALIDHEVISTGAELISTLPQALKFLSTALSTRFDRALLSIAPSLSKLSSLRLGFARGASVPIAVAMVGATKAVYGNRRAATIGVGRGTSVGTLSVPQAWPAGRPQARSAPTSRALR
ncbi:PPE family protein [Mycobacterium sp. IS-836]|uniref:PPE family protein n=1 Tax=Mycobacterium sp. IS-836 TaxID=1834160 RepID=UPI0013018140|nr:PPE family protein [Mycobacterium sp. IS-836]